MKISINWLKDFVDIKDNEIEKLLENFTLRVAEVDSVFYLGKNINSIVVGEIIECEKAPNSKKLSLCKVCVGGKTPLDIVCGAPNARKGLKTAIALEGAVLPGDLVIKPTTVAGYPSNGMCCGPDELGIGHSDGILELTEQDLTVNGKKVKNGTDIKQVLPIEDVVFEIDNKSLTNRPDMWGIYGVAREVAAILDKPLKELQKEKLPVVRATDRSAMGTYVGGEGRPIEICEGVHRYSCITIENITGSRKQETGNGENEFINHQLLITNHQSPTTPLYIQIRMHYVGQRSINLLADLTNYVMLEMGQPMHAFDKKHIGVLSVQNNFEGEFETLDNTKRNIDKGMMMIMSEGTPVAVAGVIGGLESATEVGTNAIVLESATFCPVSVRKTSNKLGVRTDSSARFEKTLDPELTMQAIARFVHLLKNIVPDINVSDLHDTWAKKYPEIKVILTKDYINRITGIDIKKDKIISILTSLGFIVKYNETKKSFEVKVPSWRRTKDISIKEDIIEEISRIYGYDNFKPIPPLFSIQNYGKNKFDINSELNKYVPQSSRLVRRIKNILVDKFSLNEIHSYIWQDAKKLKKLGIEVEKNIRIQNAQNSENDTLRKTIVSSLLPVVYENRFYDDEFGVFEIGRIFDREDRQIKEEMSLGCVLLSKTKKEKELFNEAVRIIKYILKDTKGISPHFILDTEATFKKEYEHPKNFYIICTEEEPVGILNLVHPNIKDEIDKNASIVCFELYFNAFGVKEKGKEKISEVSKYPSMSYDLTLIMNKNILFCDIENAWANADIEALKKVEVIDLFEKDEKINALTLRFHFSLQERSLTQEEVNSAMEEVRERLEERGVRFNA
ncbi:MAG: phenylalanine--tRNA ligase subunit beta [Firmicutes bacterium]|nr:phenylalanine--tRNA ligase subunit beta [Bacillota bacterium]